MIPFGLLAGFAGDREIRITKLDETGFGFRLCKENQMMASGNTKAGKDKTNTVPQQLFRLCFYDLEKGEYNEVKISFYDLKKETDEPSEFYEKFWVHFLRNYEVFLHLCHVHCMEIKTMLQLLYYTQWILQADPKKLPFCR